MELEPVNIKYIITQPLQCTRELIFSLFGLILMSPRMYLFSTKTQFKYFRYIPNNMRSLKNIPFCDILGAKIIYKVDQHHCVGAVLKGA